MNCLLLITIFTLIKLEQGYNWTNYVVPSSEYAASSLSVISYSAEYPMFSYYILSAGVTRVITVKCLDRTCSNQKTDFIYGQTGILPQSSDKQSDISLYMEVTGDVSISFKDILTNGITLYKCAANENCLAPIIQIQASSNASTPILAENNDGLYIVSINIDNELEGYDCSGGSCIEQVIDTTKLYKFISAYDKADGFLNIVSQANDTSNYIVNCDNDICSSSEVYTYATINNGIFVDSHIAGDRFPSTVYWSGSSEKYVFIHCSDEDCSGPVSTNYISIPTASNTNAKFFSGILGSNGYTLMVYQDSAMNNLNLITCLNYTCSIYTNQTIFTNILIDSQMKLVLTKYDGLSIIYRNISDFKVYILSAGCNPGDVYTHGSDIKCNKCPSGYITSTGLESECTICPNGTYSNLELTQCLTCSPGTYNPSEGAWTINNCTSCPIGYFNNITGSDTCTKCPFGEYQDEEGQIQCKECPIGTYNSILGANNISQCIECDNGFYGDVTGSSICKSCTPGTYQDEFGQIDCKLCNAGKYGPSTAAASETLCSNCLGGTYSDAGSDSCDICPEDTYQNTEGSDECIDCPNGGVCKEGTSVPVSDYGFQANPDNLFTFYECVPAEACPGENKCKAGYETVDAYCSSCSLNYFRIQGRCDECPNDTAWIIAGLVIIYVLFVLLSVPVGSQGHKFGIVSTFISYLQIISLYGYFDVNGGPLWNGLFKALSVALFNLELISPECSGAGIDYYEMWRLQMSLPYITMGILLIDYVFMSNYNKYKPYNRSDIIGEYKYFNSVLNKIREIYIELRTVGSTQLRIYYYGAGLFMITILYAIVTKASVSILTCIEHSDRQVLSSNLSIECYTEEWNSHVWFAWVTLIVYTIGLPLTLLVIFKFHHDVLEDPNTNLILGCVTDKYKNRHPYYEILIMTRKSLIIVLVFTLFDSPLTAIVIIMAMMIMSFIIVYKYQPFWTIHLNRFDYMTSVSSWIILIFAAILESDANTPGNTKTTIGICSIVSMVISCLYGCYLGFLHGVLYKRDKSDPSTSSGKVLFTLISKV